MSAMHKMMGVLFTGAFVLSGAMAALGGTPCTDEVPPSRYRYEPAQPYQLLYLPEVLMPRFCGHRANGDPQTYGCADLDSRTIYIGKGLPKDWQACLVTHEKAHLNGWPADHPD